MENDRCTNVDSVINPELAPLNIKTALEENDVDTINKRWFSKRCIPEKRDGLEGVYKTFGKDWNRQSHFASLTDQYWLGSSMDDRWEDINFFTRRYDRAIGDAFFKSWQVDKLKSDDSPDITTNGLIKKRWLQLDGYTSYLVKAGNPKLQQEPLNEVLATMVLKKLDIIPFVPYEFRVEGFTLCSICKNFVDENTEFVPASYLVLPRIEKEDGSDIYEKTLLIAEEIGIKGYKDFMDKMLMVDYIIQNTDRHLGNFGFIRNVETGKFVGPAPLFDNGTAFWNTAKNGETYQDKLKIPNLEYIVNSQKEKYKDKLKVLGKDNGYISLIDEYPYITLSRKERIKDGMANMFSQGIKVSRTMLEREANWSASLEKSITHD